MDLALTRGERTVTVLTGGMRPMLNLLGGGSYGRRIVAIRRLAPRA